MTLGCVCCSVCGGRFTCRASSKVTSNLPAECLVTSYLHTETMGSTRGVLRALGQNRENMQKTLKQPHQAWQILCSWSGNTHCPQPNPTHQHPVSWISSGTHVSILYQVSVESYGLALCGKQQHDVVKIFGVSRFESNSIFAIYRWNEWASSLTLRLSIFSTISVGATSQGEYEEQERTLWAQKHNSGVNLLPTSTLSSWGRNAIPSPSQVLGHDCKACTLPATGSLWHLCQDG